MLKFKDPTLSSSRTRWTWSGLEWYYAKNRLGGTWDEFRDNRRRGTFREFAYNGSDLVLYDPQRDLYALLTTSQAFFGYKQPAVVNVRNIRGYGSWTTATSTRRFFFFFFCFLLFFSSNI